jgi:hypothetical protein
MSCSRQRNARQQSDQNKTQLLGFSGTGERRLYGSSNASNRVNAPHRLGVRGDDRTYARELGSLNEELEAAVL